MDAPVYNVELFACLGCDQTEQIAGSKEAPADEQARAKGWRYGVTHSGAQHSYCPRCSGINRSYWHDRATLPQINGSINRAWGRAS